MMESNSAEVNFCVEKGQGQSSIKIPEVQVHSSHSGIDIPEERGHSSLEIPEDDLRVLAAMKEEISNIKREVSDEPLGNIKALFSLNCQGVEEVCVGPHSPRAREPMERLKIECLAYVTQSSGINLKEIWQRMLQYKPRIRESYKCTESGGSSLYECRGCGGWAYSDEVLLGRMILDGCFILEFFRFQYFVLQKDIEVLHPIAQVERRKLPIIFRDLLHHGNQIPFLVLEQLFQIWDPLFEEGELSITDRLLNIIGAVSLDALGVGRDYAMDCSFHLERFERKFGFAGLKPLHLLDLIRLCFNLPHLAKQDALGDRPQWNIALHGDNIPCISRLRLAGIKVSQQNRDHYLDVTFQAGAIKMPRIILNELMCSFLSNCVKFERQCKIASKHISFYVLLLFCLVDDAGDIGYLRQRRVLEHHKKTDGELADFINNLGREISFDDRDSNYFKICRDVNKYYLSEPRRKWVSFKSEYIEKPWLVISVLAASVLLILTCVQTYYDIHPQK